MRIEAHVGPSGTKGKGKKKAEDEEDDAVEGIIYRVSTTQTLTDLSADLVRRCLPRR